MKRVATKWNYSSRAHAQPIFHVFRVEYELLDALSTITTIPPQLLYEKFDWSAVVLDLNARKYISYCMKSSIKVQYKF